MYAMNEISLDLINRLEEVLLWKPWTEGSIEDFFDEYKLYTTIFSPSSTESLNIPKTSILNILVPLGVQPNRDSHYLKTKFQFYDTETGTFTRIPDTKEFFDQALASVVEFINISTYLYDKLAYMGRSDMQGDMLKFLIVAASSVYEELYSSRGKIEFAYYFKKLLQCDNNIECEITPYNRESWRGDFAKYTKLTKQAIDELIDDNDNGSTSIVISNIKLSIGKKIDPDILPVEKRYFIEMEVGYKNKASEQIFITNFI
jgi:hypothetical protein